MLGFISKEDKKKVLQKIRENKEKDVETWKYVTEKSCVILVLSMLLTALSIGVIENVNILSWEFIMVAIIALVLAVISYIGLIRDLTELTRENKNEHVGGKNDKSR